MHTELALKTNKRRKNTETLFYHGTTHNCTDRDYQEIKIL